MKQVSNIDPFDNLQSKVTARKRAELWKAQKEQERMAGYEQLTDLCRLGETEMAQRLAEKNPHWGYTIEQGYVEDNRYHYLTELCESGELEQAEQFLQENPHWGYRVVEGSLKAEF